MRFRPSKTCRPRCFQRLICRAAVVATLVLGAGVCAQDQDPAAKPPAPSPGRTGPRTPSPAAPAPSSAPAQTQPATTTQADLPSAKEIINRGIDAMGGEKAINAIQSSMVKASGTIPGGGEVVSVEMSWMKPNMFLIKQLAPQSTMAGSDGVVAWTKNDEGYQVIEPELAKQVQSDANMFRMLITMRDESKELKTVERTNYADTDCYKISLIDEAGTESFAFFGVEDRLIRGQMIPMRRVSATFSDWKADADIKFFTKMVMEQPTQALTLTFTKVEFNKLDASLFELPQEVRAMLKEQEAPPTRPATQPSTMPSPAGG